MEQLRTALASETERRQALETDADAQTSALSQQVSEWRLGDVTVGKTWGEAGGFGEFMVDLWWIYGELWWIYGEFMAIFWGSLRIDVILSVIDVNFIGEFMRFFMGI